MFAVELQGTYLHGFKSYPKWIQISFNIEFVVSLRIPFQTNFWTIKLYRPDFYELWDGIGCPLLVNMDHTGMKWSNNN